MNLIGIEKENTILHAINEIMQTEGLEETEEESREEEAASCCETLIKIMKLVYSGTISLFLDQWHGDYLLVNNGFQLQY